MYIEDIARDLIIAVAYGDAFGLPFENMDENFGRHVKELWPIRLNKFVGKHPAGTWSDDTHLTLATAVGLTRAREFDLDTMAAVHVEAYEATLRPTAGRLGAAIVTTEKARSWGRGTTDSVKRLRDGISPARSGSPGSLGNGVLVKMAPLVLWQIVGQVPRDVRREQISQFTRMTHDNDDSVRVAEAYAAILEGLSNKEPIRSLFGGIPGRDELYKQTPRRGFLAEETLLVAAHFFHQNPWFPENIWRAVGFGGDADSICSILGAMSVFNGTYRDPKDIKTLYDYKRLVSVARELDDIL